MSRLETCKFNWIFLLSEPVFLMNFSRDQNPEKGNTVLQQILGNLAKKIYVAFCEFFAARRGDAGLGQHE